MGMKTMEEPNMTTRTRTRPSTEPRLALAALLLAVPFGRARATPALAATSGTIVAWGNNGDGETNVPAGLSGVSAIAAGFEHTVALKSDGTVVAWGYNGYGETTVPAGLGGVSAIAAGYGHTV